MERKYLQYCNTVHFKARYIVGYLIDFTIWGVKNISTLVA